MKYKSLLSTILIWLLFTANLAAEDLLEDYWSEQQANETLDKTRQVFLDPDLSALTAGEQSAVQKLIAAGHIINGLYEDSMHPQALSSKLELQNLAGNEAHKQSLMDLYYIFKGPIASTLDNRRVPFLPVTAEEPGKNVYPVGMTRVIMELAITT